MFVLYVRALLSRQRCPRAKLFTEFGTLLFTCRSFIPWKNQFQGKWKIIVQRCVCVCGESEAKGFLCVRGVVFVFVFVYAGRGYIFGGAKVNVQILGWAYIIFGLCCLLELLLCVVSFCLSVFSPKHDVTVLSFGWHVLFTWHNNKQRFYLFKWHFSFIK